MLIRSSSVALRLPFAGLQAELGQRKTLKAVGSLTWSARSTDKQENSSKILQGVQTRTLSTARPARLKHCQCLQSESLGTLLPNIESENSKK